MVRRRIAALLSALALLHLPMVAGGAACADPVSMDRTAEAGHAAAAVAHRGDDGDKGHSCGTEGDARCCTSGASCSTTALLPDQERPETEAAVVDRARATSIEVPQSFRPTLEPPPPKG